MQNTPLKKLAIVATLLAISGCGQSPSTQDKAKSQPAAKKEQQLTADKAATKPVIYQMLPRIFGNQNTTNKPWGTLEENGVGKFSDINNNALAAIKNMGVDYIWYTGVPHHAVIRDYSEYGISNDDPDVVKGRAGSPYAVKDYYQVDPDLADDVTKRRQEFKSLIKRTHQAGMKVIIDIVPNHVARHYQSLGAPKGIKDFGADDNKQVTYSRENNFYYVPGLAFKVPQWRNGYLPLGGEQNPMVDGKFDENPAKWTGNGSRNSQPDMDDWYETVKINYGVKPDGSYDFATLPDDFAQKEFQQHAAFWQKQNIPNSWTKFRDICLFWLDFGVDGFRYDTAELVPVEFWSYLNSAIKQHSPDALLVAEVYNPKTYRDFIFKGKMDLLYDKVDFYDRIRAVMSGKAGVESLNPEMTRYSDIDAHMLHFLENHDEQRIASSGFAGNADVGIPAMAVSALFDRGANMLFYAQDLGEKAEQGAGFGGPTRTSIFDYQGLDKLARWNNGGQFNQQKLTQKEKHLQNAYAAILKISKQPIFAKGEFVDLQNAVQLKSDNPAVFAFARKLNDKLVVVVANFSASESSAISLALPKVIAIDSTIKPVVKTMSAASNIAESQLTLPSNGDGIELQQIGAYGVELVTFKLLN